MGRPKLAKRQERTARISRARVRQLDNGITTRKARRKTKVDAQHLDSGAKPSFWRFAASSMTCTAVDQGFAALLFWLLRGPLATNPLLRIFLSSLLARCVALSLNYVLNRRLVFSLEDADGRRPRKRESLPRFIALAAFVLGLSTLGVYAANEFLHVDEWKAKLCVDFALFFLNYYGQRKWVFKTEAAVSMGRRGARTRDKDAAKS